MTRTKEQPETLSLDDDDAEVDDADSTSVRFWDDDNEPDAAAIGGNGTNGCNDDGSDTRERPNC